MLSIHSKVVRETPAVRQNKRVSDLRLPPMPKAPDEILPVPNGINEWACLQVLWPCLRETCLPILCKILRQVVPPLRLLVTSMLMRSGTCVWPPHRMP